MTTSLPLDLGVSIDARTAFVELLLAVERVNGAGQTLPCQTTRSEDWLDDARLSARNAAAEACRWCPVIGPCGIYADAAGERHHVWGGRDRARRLPKEAA